MVLLLSLLLFMLFYFIYFIYWLSISGKLTVGSIPYWIMWSRDTDVWLWLECPPFLA